MPIFVKVQLKKCPRRGRLEVETGQNYVQGCILLTYLSVISSKFIQKFARKCQYFNLIDQSVPLYNFYITFYLRTNQL